MGDSNLRKISQAEQQSCTSRAERSLAPTGMAVCGGVRTKRKESARKLRIECHEDGATLELVSAGE